MWGVKEQEEVYSTNIFWVLEADHFIKTNIRSATQEIYLLESPNVY